MSTARKVQKKRNKQRSRSTDDRGEEGHKTTHSNENDGAEDDDDSDEAEKRHWHDVSRAFCSYEGTHLTSPTSLTYCHCYRLSQSPTRIMYISLSAF